MGIVINSFLASTPNYYRDIQVNKYIGSLDQKNSFQPLYKEKKVHYSVFEVFWLFSILSIGINNTSFESLGVELWSLGTKIVISRKSKPKLKPLENIYTQIDLTFALKS